MSVLVLASTSPTRRQILERAGIKHRVVAPNVDEDVAKRALRLEGASPRDTADALAELKAMAGWARSQAPTLGCDQTLEFEGECFDKAPDIATLRAQLLRLRGQQHQLYAALVLVEDGRPTWRETITVRLTMRAFSESFLEDYLETHGDNLLGSVGGYRIEAEGIQLLNAIDGDHFAILGLPLLGLLGALRLRGLAQR